MRLPILLALSVLSPCAACTSMATQGGFARSSPVLTARPATPVRRVFTSRLQAADRQSKLETVAGASRAWGSVQIIANDDNTFEYVATIHNPDEETFTAAVVRRGEPVADGEVVATLFSDVTLRSRYIQLRGTVSLARGVPLAALEEELRENPRHFSIKVLSSAGSPGRAIGGTLN